MCNIINDFGKQLAETLADGFKFLKNKSKLVKKIDGGLITIYLDILPASKSGYGKLAAHGHIRIDCIENVYLPHHPFLSAADKKEHSTIVFNCDGLYQDKKLADSFELDMNKLPFLVSQYSKAFKQDVLPLLTYYSNAEVLVKAFESEKKNMWPTADRVSRYLILISFYKLKGKHSALQTMLSEFSEYCKKPSAIAYQPLASALVQKLLD